MRHWYQATLPAGRLKVAFRTTSGTLKLPSYRASRTSGKPSRRGKALRRNSLFTLLPKEKTMQIPVFSQRDPRWKDQKLGADAHSTIGEFGCLLTDMAMVAACYGFDVTPKSLNRKMKQVGGFQGAFIIPARLPAALPGMLFQDYRRCRNQPAPLGEIDAALESGQPVIVEVDYAPRSGLQSHWVVLSERRGSDYLIRDPWPYPPEEGEATLLSRFGFAGRAEDVILAVLWLAGPSRPPEPPSDKIIASFPLYVMTEDLALRSRPVVAADTLIERLPLDTRLEVLTTDEEASRKVGIVGEWLPVRTPAGSRGYTAAWYLSREKQSGGETPDGQPDGEEVASFPVFTAVEDLALRSRPVVAADTLIERLPLNTRLEVLTGDEEAHRKVGTAGAWLPVRTAEGTVGYTAAWYLSKQPLQPPPPPPPGGRLRVRTTVEGLTFRSSPRILPETVLGRLPFHTPLTVLGAAEQERPKIGALNQWLRVETPAGQRGYVAAWYVEALPASAPPPDEDESLRVQVTADNLALRSLPRVADETLLKRLALHTSLLVLETPAAARRKLGQFGRWLLVRDPQGTEGYVAAWYVTLDT